MRKVLFEKIKCRRLPFQARCKLVVWQFRVVGNPGTSLAYNAKHSTGKNQLDFKYLIPRLTVTCNVAYLIQT